MPRRDKTFKVVDIIRITSNTMDTSELRLLFFWFQAIIPAIILRDYFDENFVMKGPSKHPFLKWYSLYRKLNRIVKWDPLEFIIRAFYPRDYLTIIKCIDKIQGKFGVVRD